MRLELARLPTPLQPALRLSQAWGGPTIWIKRDDLTGFGVSGNKIRKLEYHLAAAKHAGADVIITCGAAQSNHCRTTALVCAAMGLDAQVVLRTPDGKPPAGARGNYLLQLLAGAIPHFVDPATYRRNSEVMAELAGRLEHAGRKPWVIPEGASDALGMLGFVTAMEELSDQLDAIGLRPAAVWHAASSGGTTAGLGLAASLGGLDIPIISSSIGETRAELTEIVDRIWDGAATEAPPQAQVAVIDDYIGGGYGVVSEAELRVQVEATRLTGLLFDPTYTGKALYGLYQEIRSGRWGDDDDVVFWHTGGGFAVFAHDFGAVI